MSRPKRFQEAGLIYHVMARGNNRMPIFLDDLDHARFLDMLGNVVQDFEIDSWIYCLMRNHYHLLWRTRRPNLSEAVRQLNGDFARWWNTRHEHVGHVFQGRFKGQIVESGIYLLRVCRYVLMNPVRAGLCTHPGDWAWSSYKAIAHRRSIRAADEASLLTLLGGTDPEAMRTRLIQYLDGEIDEEMAMFFRTDRRVIGSDAFAAQFRRRARASPKEIPARDRRVGMPALVDILAEAVSRGRGLAFGVRRAHEEGEYSVVDIAKSAGLSRRTVARIIGERRRSAPDVTLTPADVPIADLAPGDAAALAPSADAECQTQTWPLLP